MTGSTFLLVFLFLQVFLMGALAAVAIRYAYAHFRPSPREPAAPAPAPVKDYLTPAIKEQLVQASRAQFQAALKQSASKWQQDLNVSGEHINNLVMRLATEIVAGEMESYRTKLSKLHNQADTEMGGISKEMAKHQDELKAKMAQEIEAEKQRLIKQIDTRLGDAVSSFLLEALQHNVDLGSQGPYLMELLEQHKAELIREVQDGTQST